MKAKGPIALWIAFSGFGHAAALVQTQNHAFSPNGIQNMAFNSFNSEIGDLKQMSVSVLLNKIGGRFEVDHDAESSGTITLTQGVLCILTANGVVLLHDDFSSLGATGTLNATNALKNPHAAATIGDTSTAFNSTGLNDHVLHDPSNTPVVDMGNIGNLFISSHVGTGTFTTTMNATQVVSASVLDGPQQASTTSSVSGYAPVTYDSTSITAVPEPESALVGGIGILFLLRRRR